MGLFNSFSRGARRAVYWANARALQEGASEIKEEHILYGLLQEDPHLFTLVAGDNPKLASQIEHSLVADGEVSKPRARTAVVQLSEAGKEIIRVAARERGRLKHREVSTQHLLLAVLICPEKRKSLFRRFALPKMSRARQILVKHCVLAESVRALAETTTSLGTMLNEAYTLIKSKEYEKSRQILLAALDFRNSIHDGARLDWIVNSLAATWLAQEQFDEQITFFSNYLSRYPDDCPGYRSRAHAFWYADRLNDALNDYSRAIELNDKDILSRSGRGQVLAELGRSEEAMADLDVALQLLDSLRHTDGTRLEWCRNIEAFVRRGRGVALAASGQMEEAMHEFTTSVTLKPDNAWVYYSKATVYDQQADQQHALAEYSTAITKSEPPLTPSQRERARTRINVLSQ